MRIFAAWSPSECKQSLVMTQRDKVKSFTIEFDTRQHHGHQFFVFQSLISPHSEHRKSQQIYSVLAQSHQTLTSSLFK